MGSRRVRDDFDDVDLRRMDRISCDVASIYFVGRVYVGDEFDALKK